MLTLETESAGKRSDVSLTDVDDAIDGLSCDAGNAFVILARAERDYVQALCGDDDEFQIEYRDAATDKHFRGKVPLARDRVKEVFGAFYRDDPKWKSLVKWIPADDLTSTKKRGCAGGTAAMLLLAVGAIWVVVTR